MLDYCPMCGSDDLEYINNGESHCNDCGYITDEDQEECS